MVPPHGLLGKKSTVTVLSGFTGFIDELLHKGDQNTAVIFDRLQENGYSGSKSPIKRYVAAHKHLLPPKRKIVASQGNRGRRYTTKPGERYQMDWGFVNVETSSGETCKIVCFAMICNACGKRTWSSFQTRNRKVCSSGYFTPACKWESRKESLRIT